MAKKVLLIVIDALASRVVEPALAEGRLPHFQELIDHGQVDFNCTAVFPSITPAATAGIITGRYPARHGIGGAHWYDRERDLIAYYGDDIWVILQHGPGAFFKDFCGRLNREFLQADTLYQMVERAGLSAACLNYLWFRGEVEHKVHVPLLMKLIPGVPLSEHVDGPSILSLGDFVTTRLSSGETLKGPGGVRRRYGFNDANTARKLLQLARAGNLPALTVAYFPDNDFTSHEESPQGALPVLEEIDRTLGALNTCWGGVEAMLAETAVMIVGDHAQSDMHPDPQEAAIDLGDRLGDFEQVPAGQAWEHQEQLMICPNMRAAQVYLRRDLRPRLEEVVRALLDDPRVDQVIWDLDAAHQPPGRYVVATADRGRLTLTPGAGPGPQAADAYGQPWHWEGSLATVDARVDPAGRLTWGAYPNAFERIATGFHPAATGDLWVTARPGHAFRVPGTTLHSAGSHGALNRDDSQTTLILAGAPPHVRLPAHPRTVDVAPLCLAVLGLTDDVPGLERSHVAV